MSDNAGTMKTSLNRAWFIKMLIMTIALLAFGTWGLYDAVKVYPERGERYASWAEGQYLQKAKEANDRESFGVFTRETSVPNPEEELMRLRENEADNFADANNLDSRRTIRAQMELARMEWLTSLERVGQLTPERTTYDNPTARLNELNEAWSNRPAPSALKFYDIPSQWLIMIVCWSIGGYMLLLFIRVASKSYTWDPATQTLTLPGGKSLTPNDLEEVDKRKWDKFIVVLVMTKDAKELAGERVRCDTYRYAKLEDWILEMEKTAFPELADEEDSEDKAETAVTAAEKPESDPASAEAETAAEDDAEKA